MSSTQPPYTEQPKQRWYSKPGRYLLYLILGYGAVCGAYYYYQHLFFFQPKELDVNHALSFPFRAKFKEAKLPFDSQTNIDVVKFLPTDSPARGVVLFFHGNRYNVEHYSTYAPWFTRHGYECWMPDYPGYGRSRGEISVPLLQQMAEQLYKMARTQYSSEQIIIYGKSLGTGVASYLSAKRDCRLLILETPYQSLSALAGSYAFFIPTRWLTRYQLSNMEGVANTYAPVLVMHGTRDALIPLSHAAVIQQVFKPADKFYTIPMAGHNTIPQFAQYGKILDSALQAR